jgi:hypothetical protein
MHPKKMKRTPAAVDRAAQMMDLFAPALRTLSCGLNDVTRISTFEHYTFPFEGVELVLTDALLRPSRFQRAPLGHSGTSPKMAEDVGFEPTCRGTPDRSAFKTAAIDLSANLPELVPQQGLEP